MQLEQNNFIASLYNTGKFYFLNEKLTALFICRFLWLEIAVCNVAFTCLQPCSILIFLC